jgi:hypothetical protein
MANRGSGTERTGGQQATDAGPTTTSDAMEERVVAFAEQLGRMVGTVQARAEGWMETERLSAQIAGVRDAAAELLERLGGGATRISKKKPATVRGGREARSGGVVDAPGKKHRRPIPSDPGAKVVGSQAAKMRTAKVMAKTNRRRGRG